MSFHEHKVLSIRLHSTVFFQLQPAVLISLSTMFCEPFPFLLPGNTCLVQWLEVPGSIPGYTLEIFLEVQGLERGPPRLVRTIGQLLDMYVEFSVRRQVLPSTCTTRAVHISVFQAKARSEVVCQFLSSLRNTFHCTHRHKSAVNTTTKHPHAPKQLPKCHSHKWDRAFMGTANCFSLSQQTNATLLHPSYTATGRLDMRSSEIRLRKLKLRLRDKGFANHKVTCTAIWQQPLQSVLPLRSYSATNLIIIIMISIIIITITIITIIIIVVVVVVVYRTQ